LAEAVRAIWGDSATSVTVELKNAEEELKYLRQALERLTPEELDAYAQGISGWSDEEYDEKALQLTQKLIAEEYIGSIPPIQNPDNVGGIRLGGGALLGPNSVGNIIHSEKEYPRMEFAEVFERENGVAFDRESMEKYFKKEAEVLNLIGWDNDYKQLHSILGELKLALGQNPTEGLYSDQREYDDTVKREKNLSKVMNTLPLVLNRLYGDDKDKWISVIKEMGYEKFINRDEKGNVQIDIREADFHDLRAFVTDLDEKLTANYTENMKGKTAEEYYEELKVAYTEAFGEVNAEAFARLYAESQAKGVGAVYKTVDVTGFLLMVAAQFIPGLGQGAAAAMMWTGLGITAFGMPEYLR
jgi:hypothetical protein